MIPLKHRITNKTLSGFGLLACLALFSNSQATPDTDLASHLSATISETESIPTLASLRKALSEGSITSEEITTKYLERIAVLDQSGPSLRSFISLNPDALVQAKASDRRRRDDRLLGPLDGIPIAIKDNVETSDPIPTTAGSTALMNYFSNKDSPIIESVRNAGAVILGKTNLSQWANFRSTYSVSGWSSVGGQVKNPHILDRTPCGSSSGSAVAVAAGLVTLAIGTETNGSIICPAHMNGVVGFKPTVGLLSTEGIVPISNSQDTAGPIATTVLGAAALMDAMTSSAHDFESELENASVVGKKIGILRFAQGDRDDINAAFERALGVLRGLGAELIEIRSFSLPDSQFWADELTVLETEFAALIDRFLSDRKLESGPQSLTELIEFNQVNSAVEMPLFGQEHFLSSLKRAGTNSTEYQSALQNVRRAARSQGIDQLLAISGSDLLIAPSGPIAPPIDLINGDVWPKRVGVGYLAAVAGYPHITVPMGVVQGMPIGMSFFGASGRDSLVLATAHAWQTASKIFPHPKFVPSAVAREDLAETQRGIDL